MLTRWDNMQFQWQIYRGLDLWRRLAAWRNCWWKWSSSLILQSQEDFIHRNCLPWRCFCTQKTSSPPFTMWKLQFAFMSIIYGVELFRWFDLLCWNFNITRLHIAYYFSSSGLAWKIWKGSVVIFHSVIRFYIKPILRSLRGFCR